MYTVSPSVVTPGSEVKDVKGILVHLISENGIFQTFRARDQSSTSDCFFSFWSFVKYYTSIISISIIIVSLLSILYHFKTLPS